MVVNQKRKCILSISSSEGSEIEEPEVTPRRSVRLRDSNKRIKRSSLSLEAVSSGISDISSPFIRKHRGQQLGDQRDGPQTNSTTPRRPARPKTKSSRLASSARKRKLPAAEIEYPAKCILEEATNEQEELQYLVRWDCKDPETDTTWPDQWLPAEYANEALVRDWKIHRAKHQGQIERTPPIETQISTIEVRSASEQPLDTQTPLNNEDFDIRKSGNTAAFDSPEIPRSSPIYSISQPTSNNRAYVQIFCEKIDDRTTSSSSSEDSRSSISSVSASTHFATAPSQGYDVQESLTQGEAVAQAGVPGSVEHSSLSNITIDSSMRTVEQLQNVRELVAHDSRGIGDLFQHESQDESQDDWGYQESQNSTDYQRIELQSSFEHKHSGTQGSFEATGSEAIRSTSSSIPEPPLRSPHWDLLDMAPSRPHTPSLSNKKPVSETGSSYRDRRRRHYNRELGETPASRTADKIESNATQQSQISASGFAESTPQSSNKRDAEKMSSSGEDNSELIVSNVRSARSPSSAGLENVSVPSQSQLHTQPLRVQVDLPPDQKPVMTDTDMSQAFQSPHSPFLTETASSSKPVSAQPELRRLRGYHYIPLPLFSEIRQHYASTFRYHQKELEDFLILATSGNRQREIPGKIRMLIQKLHAFTTHQDMVQTETWTQIAPADQVKWDISRSSKFAFLYSLFESLRERSIHIALFAKAGRSQATAALFLEGMDLSFVRADAQPDSNLTPISPLRVSLFDTSIARDDFPGENFDLVIGLDETFEARQWQNMPNRSEDTKCPIVKLIVVNTLEHLEHILGYSTEDTASAATLLQRAQILASHAGYPQNNLPSAQYLGEAVAEALQGGTYKDLPDIEAFSAFVREQYASMPVSSIIPSLPDSLTLDSDPKHPLQSLQDTERPSKRMRLTPQLDQSQILTPHHPSTSSANLTSGPRLPTASEPFTSLIAETQTNLTNALTRERQLQQTNSIQMSAIAEMQPRQEALHRENMDLRRQVATLGAMQEQVVALTDRLRKTEAERNELKSELNNARKTLAESTALEQHESETVSAAPAQTQDHEKKIASLEQQLEYVRNAYQTASAAHSEAASRLAELESLHKTLSGRASGEQLKLRQHFEAKHIDSSNKEIRRLKGERSLLQKQLARQTRLNNELREKNAQLEERMGMGMTTRAGSARATSVPLAPGNVPPRAGGVGMAKSASSTGAPPPTARDAAVASHTPHRLAVDAALHRSSRGGTPGDPSGRLGSQGSSGRVRDRSGQRSPMGSSSLIGLVRERDRERDSNRMQRTGPGSSVPLHRSHLREVR